MKLWNVMIPMVLAAAAVAQNPTAVKPEDVPANIREKFEREQREKAEAIARAQAEAAKPRSMPMLTNSDAEIAGAVTMLLGTFTSSASSDTPALRYAGAIVNVAGLDNAVYFEIARADSPAAPFSQGIFHFWKRKGQLVLRQYRFVGMGPDFNKTIAGIWQVPDYFPAIKHDRLGIAADVALTRTGETFAGMYAAPTDVAGAKECSGQWVIGVDSLTFADHGTSADGTKVWGVEAVTLKRASIPLSVNRREGVATYDLVFNPNAAEAGDPLGAGFEAWAHVTGYTVEGNEFWSSHNPGPDGEVKPFKIVPGQNIAGFNLGVEGITKGMIRRINIPSALGYGTRGNPRAKIAPNMDLVFVIEVLHVGPQAAPAAAVPSPVNPGKPQPAPDTIVRPMTADPKPGVK